MELFISNLHSKTTREELQESLKARLRQFNVDIYDVRKKVGKTFAQLTVADILKAQNFLKTATQSPLVVQLPVPNAQAKFSQSKRPADPQLLRVLQKEEKDWQNRKDASKLGKKVRKQHNDTQTNDSGLQVSMIECGRWSLAGTDTQFIPYFSYSADGTLTRKARTLVLKMKHNLMDVEMVMDRINILSCALSYVGPKTLTIDLGLAPKFYDRPGGGEDDMLANMLQSLLAIGRSSCFRVCTFPGAPQIVIGSCLTYRFTLVADEVDGGLRRRLQAMTFDQVPIIRLQGKSIPRPPVSSFQQEVDRLNQEVNSLNWPFALRFQVEALWANAVLSPGQVRLLLPRMLSLLGQSSNKRLASVLQRLALQLPYSTAEATFQANIIEKASAIIIQQDAFVLQEQVQASVRKSARDEVSVHRVVVTPTGIYLYGPEEVVANRILRQHRANQDCFLRVSFTDENEDRLEFDRDSSNEKVLRGRFLSILRDGLKIAGEQFDFLGFSHSSLRSQTCWFMRSFYHDGNRLHARALITSLGDFSTIRCPAKCAARIGQAFSETHSAVRIDPSIVLRYPDIQSGLYTFTDGCGTVSAATWKLLKGTSAGKDQPTLYQIRYKGAKGMISLDTSLLGHQMRLRESMIKFTGSPSDEVEICGSNARALPFKLNRQVIKILEDLGVPDATFERLQEQAVQKLRESSTSTLSAIDFLSKNMSNSSSGLPALLKALKLINIDVTEDNFLRDLLGALLQVQLREIKYRSRILVPDALTVYGICDETGFLEEGQVYVTWDTDKRQQLHLKGQIAVTRSPALHPGDIQLATAVSPPDDSILHDLHNCVVFSQKGSRDMPSMLSGGDLDGDLYNIIYDDSLIPKMTESPAAYLSAKAEDIGRSVTSHDMTEFFVDFMQNDQLGRIAILHQVFADSEPLGTRSPHCLLLAELHSTAVDFSKSGVKVDITKIPKAPPYRPDFMAPSASTKVEKGIKRPEAATEPEGEQRYRYFESDRILGRLYRAIDEDVFFENLEYDALSIFSREATDNVLAEIWRFVEDAMQYQSWIHLTDLAVQVRDYYESNMLDVMSQYAVGRTEYLTEKEVFIGTILGRSGAASKYQRDQSELLNARFNRDIRDLRSWMETQAENNGGFLALATACLYVATTRTSNMVGGMVEGDLKSFGWFAAALCVPALVETAN